MSIPFIDLKTQYEALKPQIQARINAVLEHGQYIMGPEIKELEDKLAATLASSTVFSQQRYRHPAHRIDGTGHPPW